MQQLKTTATPKPILVALFPFPAVQLPKENEGNRENQSLACEYSTREIVTCGGGSRIREALQKYQDSCKEVVRKIQQ